MYRVIEFFHDLKDGCHAYVPGDVFPREGARASKARIAELAGCDNKQGIPLIAEEKEAEKDAE